MRLPTLLLSLAVSAPTALAAQGLPGANLAVSTRATAVAMSKDTTTVTFVAQNAVSSAEPLFILTVDAPAPVLLVSQPQPATNWDIGTSYRGASVASWTALAHVAPGGSTPPLSLTAVGLPGIVTVWAEGYYPAPVLDDTSSTPDSLDVSVPDINPLDSNSVQSVGVGVDPTPFGATPANLTARLDSLRGQTCTLNWITNASLCTTLHGYLTGQPANLTQFNTDLATGHTTGGPVTDNAYWLLKANADYIISISPPPVDLALISLGYVCGNNFKVRNRNTVAVPLTWNVINGSETGALTVPAIAGGEAGSAVITTIEKRTVRLYYSGQLIATVANGSQTCPP